MFVQPLFRVAEFRAGLAASAPRDLRTYFYVSTAVISSERRLIVAARERVALQRFSVTWKDCRIVDLSDPHELGVYRLHSIYGEERDGRVVTHMRAEPELAIELDCSAAEVVDEGESTEYETQRSRIGSWEFSSWDMLLPRGAREV